MTTARVLLLVLARAAGAGRAATPRAGAHPRDAVRERAARRELHWIGEAAALLLADDLNARGLAAIRRAERVRAFEQLQLPASAVLSRATVIKIGELVGASEIIVGSVALEGNDLVVDAHSIRIDVGRLQPDVRERGPLEDVVAIFGRVASRLAPDARRAQPAPSRPPLEAFENYVKGLMAESAAAAGDVPRDGHQRASRIRPGPSGAVDRSPRARATTPRRWRRPGPYGRTRRWRGGPRSSPACRCWS